MIRTCEGGEAGGGCLLGILPRCGDPEYDRGLLGGGEYECLRLDPEVLEEELEKEDDDEPDDDRE